MSDIVLGPVLHARPSPESEWRFAVHITVKGEDSTPAPFAPRFDLRNPDAVPVTISEPELVHDFEGLKVRIWGWEVSAPRVQEERAIYYHIEGEEYGPVAIPSRSVPPRFAFFSCNGFSDPADRHKVKDPELLWRDLRERHQVGIGIDSADDRSGIHLLIGGGDQIYCDALWEREPLLTLSENPQAEVSEAKFGRIRRAYLDWYVRQWGREGFRSAYSRIPSVFTWDDHDIFDGWGSHKRKKQELPLHQAVFKAAKEAFGAVQIGGRKSPLLPNPDVHFLQTLEISSDDQRLLVVLLDLRGDRWIDRVLSEEQWSNLTSALNAFAESEDSRESYILLVSAIPLVYQRSRFEFIPIGSLEDDRRDQWEHGSRRGERARLLHHLLDSTRRGARVAIVSGDVHVASRGRVIRYADAGGADGQPTVVHQVTASAIVHPAPTPVQWAGLRTFSDDDPDILDDGTRTEVLAMTPEEKYVRARNYVLGTFVPPGARAGSLWFQWIRERDPDDDPKPEPITEQLVVRGRMS